MALVVQKYGGTSVGDTERINHVAKRVIRTREQGHQVVVVVSAMAGETDRLLRLAQQITKTPDERELDVLVATGEQVSIALLAIAIKNMGYDAKSYLGFQIKIATDSAFGKARITSIDSERIHNDLTSGRIVVIAGFQGADESDNITTLGRGGSDTTGVAIAAALKADVCEIYTDVDGVYTTDPNSAPRQGNSPRSLMTKCWRWPVWGRRSFRSDPSNLPRSMMSPFMSGHRLTTTRGQSFARRRKRWNRSSYPV